MMEYRKSKKIACDAFLAVLTLAVSTLMASEASARYGTSSRTDSSNPYGRIDVDQVPTGLLIENSGFLVDSIARFDGTSGARIASTDDWWYLNRVLSRAGAMVKEDPFVCDEADCEEFETERGCFLYDCEWKADTEECVEKEDDAPLPPNQDPDPARLLNQTGAHPLGIISHGYGRIAPGAVEDGRLIIVDGQYELPPGSTDSPFEEQHVFSVGSMYNTVGGHELPSGEIEVAFMAHPLHVITDDPSANPTLEIDFGDGRGYVPLPWGTKTIGRVEGGGRRTFRVRATYPDRVDEAGFYVNVEEYSSDYREPDRQYEVKRSARYKGTAFEWWSDDNVFDRPVIVTDGFDPNNNDRYTPQKFHDYLSSHNLLQKLNAEGYDVVMLDFCNGHGRIQKNADVLKDLIEEINEDLGTTEDKGEITIVGASMGGLVARFALVEMEEDDFHNVGKYISFDVPHRGATVPMPMQELAEFIDHKARVQLDSKSAWYATLALRTIAAKQMLVHHRSRRIYHEAFMEALEEIGYPEVPELVAIANGSGNGTAQIKENGNPLEPNDKILEWFENGIPNQDHGKRCQDGLDINIDMRAMTTDPDKTFLYADWECDGLGTSAFETFKNEDDFRPFAHVPGGWYNWSRRVFSGEALDTIKDWEYDPPTIYSKKQAFVTTVSALDIDIDEDDEDAYFYDAHAKGAAIYNDTPFDQVYFPLGTNQEHATVSAINATWLIHEVTGKPLVSCNPNLSGDWIVTDDCTVVSSATLSGNMSIEDDAEVTIADNVTLTVDLKENIVEIAQDARLVISKDAKLE